MKYLFIATLVPLLTACATAPDPQPAPRPPGAARPQAARPAPGAPPAAPRTEGRDRSAAAAPPAGGATPEPAGGTYRVRADGIVGCADAQAVRLLRQLRTTAGASPRLLAQAHRDGRCMTTFTTSTWALEHAEGEVVRLRLAGRTAGTPTTLYFLREDVAQAGAE
jgi:hypothetical protein